MHFYDGLKDFCAFLRMLSLNFCALLELFQGFLCSFENDIYRFLCPFRIGSKIFEHF